MKIINNKYKERYNLPIGMIKAPIVLFTYNRPWHMFQVLDALANNELAKESVLYIYCDGQKKESTKEEILMIEEVRGIAKNENRFKEVLVIEQEENRGLANSIITGVSEVINKHGSIIVLEDDIIPSVGFLKYMNDALLLYSNEEKVGCIHAWNYNLDSSNYAELTFFLKGADCWGWATWKRAWDLFNPSATELLANIESTNVQYEFVEMLKNQIKGSINSWAIRWHASLFLFGKYCLQPTRPIVKNIGFDNSGVHCGNMDIVQNPVDFLDIQKINIEESEWFYKEYNMLLLEEKMARSRTTLQSIKDRVKKILKNKT